MKPTLFLCLYFLSVQALYGQLPTGPDGKTLYQKGDCKTILLNVKYKCVFCEDEALTKNCKEYECSLTECKEIKNIKETGGKELSKPISIEGKQIRLNRDSSQPAAYIDITNLFTEKKVANGTVLIYESENHHKIYASYKKGKLVEWYGMGADGTKIKSSQRGITPVSCEDCIVLPNGVMTCKKCTSTPGVTVPIKKAGE